jgi:hypothetical protein
MASNFKKFWRKPPVHLPSSNSQICNGPQFSQRRSTVSNQLSIRGAGWLIVADGSRFALVESKHCAQPVTQPTNSTDRGHALNRRFLVRKSQSPKLSPSQFEPELVWTMRSVLDSAVDQIDTANRTPATKAKMAERILRAASDGITDPVTLTAMAIEEGMQAAD